ncbi:MAG: rhomboid family intramembrane serine protease [Thermoguttaceae bacterium]|nr:rhomboid family intramembrane serine protease [Thermoguttaceae bacterium]
MREFKVKFLKGQGVLGKLLNGYGTIAVSDDEVVLTRSGTSNVLWKTPPVIVTVNPNQIANVVENKELRCLQFSEYPAGKFSGQPDNVFLFKLDFDCEKAQLLELLPKQTSDEVTLETEFMDKLKQLTPYSFFTILIVALCVLVYIAMGVLEGFETCVEPNGIALLRFGADYGPLVAAGEWYRIITCAFVHIGLVHILFNMVILWQIGNFVERLYGNLLFLVVYLGSAAAGSLMSLTASPTIISAGASGAIFGLYGALLAYMVRRHGTIPLHMVSGIRNGAIAFIVFNLMYGMQPGIDNWCHVGGLLGGFFLGVIVAPPFESEERTRQCVIMSILGAAIVAAGSYSCLSSNPTKLDQKDIGNILTEFGIYYNYGNSALHIKKNVNTAANYYKRAVKFDNPVAIYNLGILYRDGDGVENDDAKAFELFKQAADLGDSDAQSEYGRMLYFEKENKKEGVEWLKKASENGSQTARFFLACIYYEGDENVEQNQEFALSELNALADSGFQPAIDLLKKLEEGVETSDSVGEPAQEDDSVPVDNAEPEEN